jgi:phosphonate degradation associated HDIG domain protein
MPDRDLPPATDGTAVVAAILRLFAERGPAAYLSEPVSQTEHALQAASAAERNGAGAALIAAALLHDVGHLVADEPDPAHTAVDHAHEERGARWLERHFGPEVTAPVRLHVAAKRYLCAVDPQYFGRLSPASVASLRLQGGPMSAAEVERFLRQPFAADAVALRRWDEEAKVAGLVTPPLEQFRDYLRAILRC